MLSFLAFFLIAGPIIFFLLKTQKIDELKLKKYDEKNPPKLFNKKNRINGGKHP
jgi:hypothetical protein